MIVVGKATQEPNNGPVDYVEVLLPDYKRIRQRQGRFAYAWTFNPDDRAIAELSQNLPFRQSLPHTWLYLIGKPYQSPLRMHVVDFRHHLQRLRCPEDWRRYCHPLEWDITRFEDRPTWPSIHIWFLVDQIEPVQPPADVTDRTRFRPLFRDKYHTYGRNHFGFFQ